MIHRMSASRGLGLAVLPWVLALAACSPPAGTDWSGYAVGEFVYVAAPLAGTIGSLAVQAGETVERGALLFALEADSEQAARDEAAARLDAAQAQQANLEKGRRAPEQAVIEAQLAQARVALAQARRELQRQQQLVAQGFVSAAQLDVAATRQSEAQAQVDGLVAALQVARLPGRSDEQAASRANVAAAGGALRQTEWRLQHTRQTAPAAGTVNEVFFRAGEFVPAGQPVLALLPPDHLKLRFFVPEAALGGLRLGQAVTVRCDGCTPLRARISHIAAQAEYTPPVIYSNAQRARLVFMVEARPAAAADASRLHPGQPVDIEPAAPETP